MREFSIKMCRVDGTTTGVFCSYSNEMTSRENKMFEKFISIAWAWMINAWNQLEMDNVNCAAMNSRAYSNLVKECFELMRMLLHFEDRGWDTMLCAMPNPKVIISLDVKKQCRDETVVSDSCSGIGALCW